jgi:hypothetical protein
MQPYQQRNSTGGKNPPVELVLPNPVAGSAIVMPAGMGINNQWVKVRSGTRVAPVAQSADRAFIIVAAMPDGTAWQ